MVSPRAKAVVAFAVGIVFLGALVVYVGPGRVLDAIREASPVYLLLGLAAYALFFLLRGIRWRTLLSRSAPDVRLSSTVSVTAVGWLANSFLPLKGGDVLRAAFLAKREGLGAGQAAASVALERVLDLVGLAVVAAVALLLIPDEGVPVWMARAIQVAWVLPIVSILGLVLLVAMRERAMRLSKRICAPFGRFGEKLHDFVETAVAGIATLAKHPRLMIRLVPESIAVAIAQALIFTFLAMAFIPTLTLPLAFGGSAIFLLSFIVSVTPGNVGTYEAAFGAIFAAFGTPLDIAVPAAILTHLTTTLIVALMGSAGMLALSASAAKPVARPARVAGGSLP